MKTIGILSVLMSISALAMAQASKNKNFYLLIGTYTNADKTNGIHVYTFNAATGEFHEKSKFTDIKNASYLAVSKDKKNVYSVSESGEGKGMNAFAFDMASGKLTYINSSSSGGNGPCYVSVDDKKQTVFAANYGSGSLGAIRLNADGSLTKDVQSIQHEGSGINKERQSKPHVHSVVLSPDERFLLVQDLGTDKVNVYRYDPKQTQPLAPADPAFASAKAGGGPRHLVFHPNGKYAYLILEMGGDIMGFDYKNGKLVTKQTITMLAPGFKGDVGAADIHISPDGKFLYGSNRGDANDIVIYSIDKKGMLTYVGRESSMIDNPRNFAIDPTGNFLLVGNQDGNDIIIFKRDQKTGLLSNTGKKILVDKPVCLKFVAID
ncbi:MAG TPA: lactonase family protein [Chryseosolibacter sp.]|nr:lactonase family protein [Chryseosolibacter sp.]